MKISFLRIFYILICLFQQINYSFSTNENNENAGIGEREFLIEDHEVWAKYMVNYKGQDEATSNDYLVSRGQIKIGKYFQDEATSNDYPVSRGQIKFGKYFQDEATSNDYPLSRGQIKIGKYFQDEATSNDYPLSRGQIKFGKYFQDEATSYDYPVSRGQIKIGKYFQDEATSNDYPVSRGQIKFGKYFQDEATSYDYPVSRGQIKIGKYFQDEATSYDYPVSRGQIKFGKYFQDEATSYDYPVSRGQIKFGKYFQDEATSNDYPVSRGQIKFGKYFQDEATSNDYPLSRGQIKFGKSVNEMHQRLLFDSQIYYPRNRNKSKSIYGEKWQTEKEIFLKKLKESKEAVECDQRAMKRIKIVYEKFIYSNNANNGIVCKMLRQAKMSRGQLLCEAVLVAANIRPFGLNSFIGHADNTDLIELATTITNIEREEMKSIWKNETYKVRLKNEKERREFFNNLFIKKNVAINAAFSYILNNMMKSIVYDSNTENKRNEEFKVDGEILQDGSKFINFLLDTKTKYTNIGSILAERNYVHLRHLVINVKNHEEIINEYKNERAKYGEFSVDGGKTIFEMTPSNMKYLYDFTNLKFLIEKRNKDQKEQLIWQLLKAILAEVEFGRPYLYAELLHEKMDLLRRSNTLNGKLTIDYPDTFTDIIRIVWTRAGIDLADIEKAYKEISIYARNDKNAMTFSEALENIAEKLFPNDVSDYGATIKICVEIVNWAVANDDKKEKPRPSETNMNPQYLPHNVQEQIKLGKRKNLY